FVVRIVEDQLHRHALVRIFRVVDFDFLNAAARDRFARAVVQHQDDEEVVLSYQRAFQFAVVGQRYCRRIAAATAASPSPPATTTTAATATGTGKPGILEITRVGNSRSDSFEVSGHRMARGAEVRKLSCTRVRIAYK